MMVLQEMDDDDVIEFGEDSIEWRWPGDDRD